MVVHKNGAKSGVFTELGWVGGSAIGVYAALFGTGYAPSSTSSTSILNWGQIKANQIATGGGYTDGGIIVPSRVMQDVDADRISWANAGSLDFGALASGRTIRWLGYREGTGTVGDSDRVFRVVDVRPFNGGNDIVTDGGTLIFNHIDGHVVGMRWQLYP